MFGRNKKLKQQLAELQLENQRLNEELSVGKMFGLSSFEKDKEFLMTIIDRALTSAISTGIEFINVQLGDSYMKDSDIEKTIEKTVNNVVSQIAGTPYEKFLLKKYFGTVEKLYTHVSDIITETLYTKSINLNLAKSARTVNAKHITDVISMNKK